MGSGPVCHPFSNLAPYLITARPPGGQDPDSQRQQPAMVNQSESRAMLLWEGAGTVIPQARERECPGSLPLAPSSVPPC